MNVTYGQKQSGHPHYFRALEQVPKYRVLSVPALNLPMERKLDAFVSYFAVHFI